MSSLYLHTYIAYAEIRAVGGSQQDQPTMDCLEKTGRGRYKTCYPALKESAAVTDL